MIKAIIFDLDGTIINSEYYIKKYLSKISKKKLNQIFEEHIEHKEQELLFTKVLGMSFEDIYYYINKHYKIKITKEKFVKKANTLLRLIYKHKIKLLPNFKKLIINLKKDGYIIALASSASKSLIYIALKKFDLKKYFSVIISADDISGHSKPDPEIYRQTSKKLKIKPKECLVFEDADNGLISARRAGMKCIGIRNGNNNTQNFKDANFIINNYKEVMLDGLINKF